MKIIRTEDPIKQAPRKKTSNSFLVIAIISVVIIVVLFFLSQQKNRQILSEKQTFNNRIVTEKISIPEPPPPVKNDSKKPAEKLPAEPLQPKQTADTDMDAIPDTSQTALSNTSPSVPEHTEDTTESVEKVIEPQTRTTPAVNETPSVFEKQCSDSTKIIKNFYSHLDAQEYMQSYGLTQDSETHFTQLIQRLLDNPPVVSGETDDLFTILQNTAHFFRVIGKNNIIILKGILDREKDQFENVLFNFHSIFHTPSCPSSSFGLNVSEKSLYDYAGFFLNTMGGRLYLFRRDSMSRMVVSYYSILLIDQANKEARNKHGIEIMTAIDQLIIEMEASPKQLKLGQLYLDNLYNLTEHYQ